jgi:hypothetical protein
MAQGMTMPAVEKLREPVEELAALLAQILGCHQLFLRRSNMSTMGESLGTRTRVGQARTRSPCQLVYDQFLPKV